MSDRYDLGWDDGYAEGYAVKLVDVASPFMPKGDASEIERAADWVQTRYITLFGKRSDAIGLVRGLVRILRERGQGDD